MYRNFLVLMMLAVVLAFTSCKDEETVEAKTVVIDADFNKNADSGGAVDGWNAVFAEYPDGEQEFYELASGIKNLPEPLDQTKKAFMLSGNNHSDALQMWLVKQLSGLAANAKFTIETEVELASKYPDGSVGIGGSPGSAVHLVSKFATEGYTLEKGKTEGYNVKLTLKKVESVPESVMEVELGDVSITSDQYVYKLITRKKSSSPNVVVTDNSGKVWAIVGTWSGFEGISTLYYTRIRITLTRI